MSDNYNLIFCLRIFLKGIIKIENILHDELVFNFLPKRNHNMGMLDHFAV
jgi:hypothetical protein